MKEEDTIPAGEGEDIEFGEELDERRRRDCMAPPTAPCECFCLHCRRIFMSDQMWFQRVKGARDGFEGFWMCPTPNCSGAGFTFDIFPTDPNHPGNAGWHSFDDEEEGEFDEESEEEWDEELDVEEDAAAGAGNLAGSEWDPDEPEYKVMDEIGGGDDDGDDWEGEEWKFGLQPGEVPQVEPPPPGVEPRNWLEQEALYNAPDRRPRELDWTHLDQDRKTIGEDDIPF